MATLTEFALKAREVGESDVFEDYVSVLKVYPFKRGVSKKGNAWTKVGIETNVGVFFGFESDLKGIGIESFIPKDGVQARLTLRKSVYKKDGKDVEGYDVVSLIADSVGLKAQLAQQGIMRAGFQGGLSLGMS